MIASQYKRANSLSLSQCINPSNKLNVMTQKIVGTSHSLKPLISQNLQQKLPRNKKVMMIGGQWRNRKVGILGVIRNLSKLKSKKVKNQI